MADVESFNVIVDNDVRMLRTDENFCDKTILIEKSTQKSIYEEDNDDEPLTGLRPRDEKAKLAKAAMCIANYKKNLLMTFVMICVTFTLFYLLNIRNLYLEHRQWRRAIFATKVRNAS